MNIIAWIGGHQTQLIALLIAIFAVTTAKKIVPKMRHKERGSHARWASFIIYIIGGLALAVAMIPTIMWLVAFGGRAGLSALVGNVTAIATFALGWHAVAMLVSMIRDLMDKQPDHEARSAALWVPTFLPIGGAAVVQVLQNPQGLGQGITAAIMGVITLVYAGMIVKRADAATEHKNMWNWFAFGVLVLAGIVIIPLVAYVDTALIAQLPSAVRTIVRVALGLSGIGLIVAGIADIWVDRSPDVHARNGARIGFALAFVFGGIGWQALVGATADGASFLNGVF
jgi:hypothetical protein